MDLDTLLHEAARVSDPDDAALARSRLALDAATHASARRIATVVRTRRRSRRWAAAVLAVTAVAAAVLVVVPSIGVHGPPSSSAQAAQVLLAAGKAAGQQPGGWPKAPYWHVVEQEQRHGGPVVRREIWLGHTQPGVLHDPIAGPGGDGYTGLTPALFLEGITWDQLYRLPTDPAGLERVLRADGVGHGQNPDSELWDMATRALVESPASPSLRRALWEVASRVPGVRLLGARTDALGRRGIALQREGETFLVDTQTGTLLQWSAGSSFRYTYVRQGPASTAPVVSGPVN